MIPQNTVICYIFCKLKSYSKEVSSYGQNYI